MVGLARLTHWNIGYELAVSLLLALTLFVVFVWQIRATARALSLREWYKLLPAVSLVVFSASQYQNWFWGFQSTLFLNMLAATAGILVLAQRNFSWSRFISAAALGLVATFSFATGVVFWPVGLVIVLFSTSGRHRLPAVLAWLALCGLAMGLFFYHLNVAGSDSVRTALSSPLECVRFLLKFAGGIVAQYPGGNIAIAGKFALILGFGAITLVVWSVRKLIRMGTVDWGTLLPYLGVSAYSLCGGALAALGRVCLGSDQAASSRYCTMAVPFWISLMVFLFLLLKCPPPETDSAARKKSVRWCFVGAVLLLALGSGLALDGASRLSARQAKGRDALLSLARNPKAQFDYSQLFALYPKLNVVVERYPVLQERRLSLFSDETRQAAGNH
jgi:hypothetical protein